MFGIVERLSATRRVLAPPCSRLSPRHRVPSTTKTTRVKNQGKQRMSPRAWMSFMDANALPLDVHTILYERTHSLHLGPGSSPAGHTGAALRTPADRRHNTSHARRARRRHSHLHACCPAKQASRTPAGSRSTASFDHYETGEIKP